MIPMIPARFQEKNYGPWQKPAVLNNFAKIDVHRSISVMIGKTSKIDSYQHYGSELRNTAQKPIR